MSEVQFSPLVPFNDTGSFSPDEELALRAIILSLGSLSFILSLFVILTFLIFKEKRRYPAWSLNTAFVGSVAVVELFLVAGAILGFEFTQAGEDDYPTIFCFIQGFVFVYFGSCMVWFWFFITLNLFMRMILNRDIDNLKLIVLGALLSLVMALPPAIMFEFDSAGAWCFISSDNWVMLYFDYYAVMGLCCFLGLFLWSAIMYKIYQSGRILSQFTSPVRDENNIQLQASLLEKRQLFFRQLAFVTVFELMFIIYVATRIIQTLNPREDFHFPAWVFHTVMMSTMGIYTFLIFGLKRQNFALWGACCSQPSVRMRLFAGRDDYEPIR